MARTSTPPFARALRPTRQERGFLSFDLNRQPSDPDVVVVYERWRSLADLEAHLRAPYVVALREALNGLVVALPEFSVLTPVGD